MLALIAVLKSRLGLLGLADAAVTVVATGVKVTAKAVGAVSAGFIELPAAFRMVSAASWVDRAIGRVRQEHVAANSRLPSCSADTDEPRMVPAELGTISKISLG